MSTQKAKFSIGDIVKHKHFDFRGVIYDVDFEFNNSEEWYQSIPKDVRPRKDQPFYHLLAESNEVTYEAYVSEQNLIIDRSGKSVRLEIDGGINTNNIAQASSAGADTFVAGTAIFGSNNYAKTITDMKKAITEEQ